MAADKKTTINIPFFDVKFDIKLDTLLLVGVVVLVMVPTVVCMMQVSQLRGRLADAEKQAQHALVQARQAHAAKVVAADNAADLRGQLAKHVRQEVSRVAAEIKPPTIDTSDLLRRSDIADLATRKELAVSVTRQSKAMVRLGQRLAGALTARDIAGLATKKSLAGLATKKSLVGLATRKSLVGLATKKSLVGLVTKESLAGLATRRELHVLTGGLIFKIQGVEKKLQAQAPANGPHGKPSK